MVYTLDEAVILVRLLKMLQKAHTGKRCSLMIGSSEGEA